MELQLYFRAHQRSSLACPGESWSTVTGKGETALQDVDDLRQLGGCSERAECCCQCEPGVCGIHIGSETGSSHQSCTGAAKLWRDHML